ncbi:MAG TPA: SRPBCC family protein [Chloroflexota bacterium]
MIVVETSVLIRRPAEEIFGYVTDVVNDPQWHTDILAAEPTSERPIGPGAVFAIKFKPFMGRSEGHGQETAARGRD